MTELSTDPIFGADINDERYFDLAKDFYERHGCNEPTKIEFSSEFQKKVIFYVLEINCITDKSEFSGNITRSVNRSSHVRQYRHDVSVQVLTYAFQFIAKNSLHVEVKIDNFTRITSPNCVSKNRINVNYSGDAIVVHIYFD